MHGRESFEFNATQRADLKKYLDDGGFLFVDCICAAKPFADAVRAS